MIDLEKPKEHDLMLANAHNALDLLTEADNIAIDLSNSRAIDYKEASCLSTYFYNALAGVRALIEHLEYKES